MTEQKIKLKGRLKKEMKKEVILTNIRDIINKLLKIMKNHIGEENKVSRNSLFKQIYNLNPEDVSQLHEWIMWEFIKKSMHKMRQRTYCFIVSKQIPLSGYSYGGVYHYWVAKDFADYVVYKNNIERNIKAMRNMVNKCERSIRLKFYEKNWEYK